MKRKIETILSALVFASLMAMELGAHAQLRITEVSPNGGGTSYNGDWFELSNIGSTNISLAGWKMDDNSFSFATAVALRNLPVSGNITPGQAIVFLEGNTSGTTDATVKSNFVWTWFGQSTLPVGLTVANYGGSGVSLGAGGDGVILFDSAGNQQVKVSFGATVLGATLDNRAGLDNTTISVLSAVNVGNAFTAPNASLASPVTFEIGSPGTVPEPSTLALGLLGVAALIFRLRMVARR